MYKKSIFYITCFIIIDQATKYLFKWLYQGQDITFVPYLLEFGYAENRGMSFGLLENQTGLFLIITVIALGMFMYLFKDISFVNKKTYTFAIILFISGTIGNAIDRFFLGYVIDFMHFPFLDTPLRLVGIPNFYNNFDDMYLFIGIVLFMIDIFFLEKKRKIHEKH
jgi:signal peptidase II